eukprot:GEZU01008897.1.p1 GENE.GEZU01008897.1~~GEZU01008897.1.p1  ORF type:complete len:269 (+),score=56.72 GEZU01008897.1:99-905(+)
MSNRYLPSSLAALGSDDIENGLKDMIGDNSGPSRTVRSTQKIQCHKCGILISSSAISTGGKTYHPECFTCFNCKSPIKESYMMRDNNFWCKSCADATNPARRAVASPTTSTTSSGAGVGSTSRPQAAAAAGSVACTACKKPITTRGVEAKGQYYHVDCFVCDGCNKPLANANMKYYIRDSKPVCESCSHKPAPFSTGNAKVSYESNITPSGKPASASAVGVGGRGRAYGDSSTVYSVDDIEKLAKFRDQGLITEEEFQEAKKELLKRI